MKINVKIRYAFGHGINSFAGFDSVEQSDKLTTGGNCVLGRIYVNMHCRKSQDINFQLFGQQ